MGPKSNHPTTPWTFKIFLSSATNTPASGPCLYFGWGESSSKPFSEQHTPPASPSPSHRARSLRECLVPRGHSHSQSFSRDVRYPRSFDLRPVPPGSHEPALLKNIETAITTPHGPQAGIDKLAEVDIASIPERIGYLKEVCGMDFGWGTTSIFQWVLEHSISTPACHGAILSSQ